MRNKIWLSLRPRNFGLTKLSVRTPPPCRVSGFEMSHYTVATCPKHTAVSREVVGRNVYVTIPKGNMGYDQYTVPND